MSELKVFRDIIADKHESVHKPTGEKIAVKCINTCWKTVETNDSAICRCESTNVYTVDTLKRYGFFITKVDKDGIDFSWIRDNIEQSDR
jgi:hypothetical protein